MGGSPEDDLNNKDGDSPVQSEDPATIGNLIDNIVGVVDEVEVKPDEVTPSDPKEEVTIEPEEEVQDADPIYYG